MTRTGTPSRSSLPALPCICANLRRATRAVTRLYNEELRPHGLEITQFTLLMALDLTGEITQRALGDLLAIDSTTLTRMLKPLAGHGWVKITIGDDRRQRLLSITAAGEQTLQESTVGWNRAQVRMRRALGDQLTSDQLNGLLVDVVTAAANA